MLEHLISLKPLANSNEMEGYLSKEKGGEMAIRIVSRTLLLQNAFKMSERTSIKEAFFAEIVVKTN